MKKALILLFGLALAGCAPSVSSNVAPATLTDASRPIIITESALGDRPSVAIKVIEVSVKRWTALHPEPTKGLADLALRDAAQALHADAVIGVTYKEGVGMFSQYIDAKGTAVRFTR